MKLKKFFIVFLISLPFWWGINLCQKSLEDFLFSQYYQPPLSAQIGFAVLDAEKEKIDVSNFDIEANAAISVKVDKGGKEKVLFEKNSEAPLPLASLTKLVTAWVVFEYPEYYDFSREVRISQESIKKEGDSGLSEGQIVSINDLLYSMLIDSSNDSAYAIAEALVPETEAKSEQIAEAFVSLMNLGAKENIGLKRTFFVNPTGLDPEDQTQIPNYSTARDLVELSKNILFKHPEIFEISKNNSALIFGDYLAVNKNIILNHNTIGRKTGWTPRAGGCILIVQKNQKGEYFINVILGTDSPDSRFSEMQKLINRYQYTNEY